MGVVGDEQLTLLQDANQHTVKSLNEILGNMSANEAKKVLQR